MTRQEFRDLVLIHLKVLAQGQTPAAQIAAVTNRAIDQQHEKLIRKGIIDWTADNIPEWAVDDMRNIVAASLIGVLPVPAALIQDYRMNANVSEMELRAMTAQHDEEPTTAEYF